MHILDTRKKHPITGSSIESVSVDGAYQGVFLCPFRKVGVNFWRKN